GLRLCRGSLIAPGPGAANSEALAQADESMAYLPMAWLGEHIFSYAQSILVGFAVNCPESTATVLADVQEIAPSYFFAPPRIWENILTNVLIRIDNSARVKRKLIHFFLELAQGIE